MPADGSPTSPSSFGFTDAAEIALAPYITEQQRAEAVRKAYHKREAEHVRGLSMHVEPFFERSDERIREDAIKARAEREAHRASPYGRLYKAICQLEQSGFPHEAYTLRGIFDRSVKRDGMEGRTAGALLAVLAKISHPASTDAINCIAEMLLARREAA